MKTISISGAPRADKGKTDAKKLRRQGQIPCILYGGKEQVFFHVHENGLTKLVYTPDIHQVKLDIGGKQYDAVMQDIQFHPVTDKILHIDFLEVAADKPVTMEVPVHTQGSAPGVKAGGKLQVKLRKLKARGLVSRIPNEILIDVNSMELGDLVAISDLKYDGVTFLHPSNYTVVAVRFTREVEEETPATTAAVTTEAAATTTTAEGTAPAAEKKEGEKKEEKKDEKKK